MELARGFGVKEYKFFYGDSGANQARFKTPSEFKKSQLDDGEWRSSFMRHILFAVHTATKSENPKEGLNYMKFSRRDYWTRKEDIQVILKFLEKSTRYSHLDHWKADGESAQLLRALVENDYGGSV